MGRRRGEDGWSLEKETSAKVNKLELVLFHFQTTEVQLTNQLGSQPRFLQIQPFPSHNLAIPILRQSNGSSLDRSSSFSIPPVSTRLALAIALTLALVSSFHSVLLMLLLLSVPAHDARGRRGRIVVGPSPSSSSSSVVVGSRRSWRRRQMDGRIGGDSESDSGRVVGRGRGRGGSGGVGRMRSVSTWVRMLVGRRRKRLLLVASMRMNFS